MWISQSTLYRIPVPFEMLSALIASQRLRAIAQGIGLTSLVFTQLAQPIQGTPIPPSVPSTQKIARATAQTSDVLLAVAIARDASSLSLGTSTLGQMVDDQGRVLQQIPANQNLTVDPKDQGIQLRGIGILPNSFWIGASQNGYVWVGSRWYRGRVRIIRRSNRLMAVNHVHLEEYLYSVVGSEMPASWPIEALKAQAVAARSYALVHYLRPASDFFHLGNTERWQVYKGLESENPRTIEAVRQTSGQVLSHRGGVVESLYASTYEIVNEAHGGNGMSQYGARDLAAQGYTYLHILGNYYPGVRLAQIRLRGR